MVRKVFYLFKSKLSCFNSFITLWCLSMFFAFGLIGVLIAMLIAPEVTFVLKWLVLAFSILAVVLFIIGIICFIAVYRKKRK